MPYVKAGPWYYRFEIKECDKNSVSWSLCITDLEFAYVSVSAGSFADTCGAVAEISPIEISEPAQLQEYIQVVVSNISPILANISLQQLESDNQILVADADGLFKWEFHFQKLNAYDTVSITRKIVLDYDCQCEELKKKLESVEELLIQKDYHIKNLLELAKPRQYVARRHKKALEEYKDKI